MINSNKLLDNWINLDIYVQNLTNDMKIFLGQEQVREYMRFVRIKATQGFGEITLPIVTFCNSYGHYLESYKG
jgi:hypothetical protein